MIVAKTKPEYFQDAKEMAGNFLKWEAFAWYDMPEDYPLWTIWNYRNRDSTILDQCNAAIIEEMMEPFTEGDDPDARLERHSHCLVGWVECVTVRCTHLGNHCEPYDIEIIGVIEFATPPVSLVGCLMAKDN